MKVIYVRISTANQNEERQLQKEGKCFIDIISGSTKFFTRPQVKEMLRYMKLNNIKEFYVDHVDRLGRNLNDVLNTIDVMTAEGINIHFSAHGLSTLDNEGKVSPIAKMVIQFLAMVAEMQLNRIKETQRDGIAVAKAKKTKYLGRKRGSLEKEETTEKKYSKALPLYQGLLNTGASVLNVHDQCKSIPELKISRNTLTSLIVKGLLIKPSNKVKLI